MITVLFVAFAAILVVSSLLVILHRNPLTSALFLVLAFCSLAAIYLLLHAEFIGLVQVVVYAGAIMVLFLFVIMYLNLGHDVEGGVTLGLRRGLGWLLGAVLVAEGALLVSRAGAWHARETRRAAVLHTVGCGDALLAGFLSACAEGKPPAEAARFGVACGSACVRSYRACLRSKAEALHYLPRIRVKKL